MGKLFISFVFLVLLVSSVSAGIVVTQQPGDLYSLGDIINLPVKITTTVDISRFFNMYLICNGVQTEIYREYIVLSAGEEKKISPFIPLTRGFLGRPTGKCTIKSVLGEEYALTNEFEISDVITITLDKDEIEINPEEILIIEGDANKENGDLVNGFIDAVIVSESIAENTTISDTVHNGYFYIEYIIPEDTKAGGHSVRLNVYEKDSEGVITNNGLLDYNIRVLQVPTSLEVMFETQEVEPGTNLQVKTILHDQTGESIESSAVIAIRSANDELKEQIDVSTDEFFEYPILYNEPPAEWSVEASSNELTSEATFMIAEKGEVKTEILNKTLVITNVGNVIYCNKSVLVKIGEQSLNVDVCLDVDESQKYLLSAPDGEYKIEVITDEGSSITGMATLTGRTVEVKKAPGAVLTLMRYPVVWIFIIFVLGFVVFMVFRKGYKRSFIGHVPAVLKRKGKATKEALAKKVSLLPVANRAEMSLSIKGDKQNVSLVCLYVKNLNEASKTKKDSEEKKTFQKIAELANEAKAVLYENQNNFSFIFVPTRTKTFKNEKTALEFADKIHGILNEYNKLFTPKIEFGISLNYGALIAKQEVGVLKFMSMGTLITAARKIATLSNKEILLSEKIRDNLGASVKTAKLIKDKIPVYIIKEMRHDREEHRKFLSEFMKRMEK